MILLIILYFNYLISHACGPMWMSWARSSSLWLCVCLANMFYPSGSHFVSGGVFSAGSAPISWTCWCHSYTCPVLIWMSRVAKVEHEDIINKCWAMPWPGGDVDVFIINLHSKPKGETRAYDKSDVCVCVVSMKMIITHSGQAVSTIEDDFIPSTSSSSLPSSSSSLL